MPRDRVRVLDARRRWPWLVAGITLFIFLLACVVYPDARTDPMFIAVFTPIISAFVVVGALLAARVTANPIGPLLLLAGIGLATAIAVGSLAFAAADRGEGPDELVALGLLVNQVGFIVPIVVVLIGIPLIFPDGRLLSPRWRSIVVLACSALAALCVSQLLMPGTIGDTELENPFGVPALEPLMQLLGTYANWTSLVGFSAALLALVIRYRVGSSIQRQQIKWLVAVAAVAGVAFPIAFIAPGEGLANAGFFVGLLALFALPVAIGVAVLRYRLYEIDRLISRTIGWTLISGVLVAAFVIFVVGLQTVLAALVGGQTQTFAVAASTLAACALFQPVRGRVQGAVDRRFDRARYDSHGTARAFAERLRDEVALDALAAQLEVTVAGAMRPTSVTLWLPRRDPAS